MKFLKTFKEHYLWIEINNSFNQRKQIFFMWSITFVVLSYNENPDSRSSVNPDNIPLQVHPKVLLYKITHIQCQNWIAFWRTRIVSLLLVKIYTYIYMIMYQHNMDATKLHDCTLYLHCYPKNDIYNDGVIWVFPLKYLLS